MNVSGAGRGGATLPRLRLAAVLLLAWIGAGCGDGGGGNQPASEYDLYGGWRAVHTTATGRFRVAQVGGVWWLITPDGNAFLSLGVNHVTPQGDFSPALGASPYRDAVLAQYGSEASWARATIERLRAWGFNTAAAWSATELFRGTLPYTTIVSFESAAPVVPNWPTSLVPRAVVDYFDPAFAAGAPAVAEQARSCAADPYCIGVFTDNEQAWGPGFVQIGTHLDAYLTLPPDAGGKRAVAEFLDARYGGDVAAFNRVWQEDLTSFDDILQRSTLGPPGASTEQLIDKFAFLEHVATHYFSVAHDALRAVDPRMLILGARFVSFQTHPAVFRAAAPFVDVVSINNYDVAAGIRQILLDGFAAEPYAYRFLADPFSDLADVYELTGKPVMITEYFYRLQRPGVAGVPFTLPEVATPEEQAAAYELYMHEVLVRPYMVGAHWFQYMDQPVTGRFDGENQLIGLVDIADTPHDLLTARMTAVNATSYDVHAAR